MRIFRCNLQNFPGGHSPGHPWNGCAFGTSPKVDLWRHTIVTKLGLSPGNFLRTPLFALYQIIKHEKNPGCFSEGETIVRLFLCLVVTNCSGERSFSKLKRIKSVLRSTLSQKRLSDLSIFCVDNDKLRLIDFEDTIDEFAAGKAGRKMFWQ